MNASAGWTSAVIPFESRPTFTACITSRAAAPNTAASGVAAGIETVRRSLWAAARGVCARVGGGGLGDGEQAQTQIAISIAAWKAIGLTDCSAVQDEARS